MFHKQYDIAQLCLNGHVSNLAGQRRPEENKPFCKHCGEKTIMACQACSTPIRGEEFGSDFSYMAAWDRPSYCTACGGQFPWTERAIQSAIELAADELGADEAKQLADGASDLVSETPRTPLAANRLRKMLDKMGPAANFMRDVLVDVVSDSVKKVLFPEKP